MSKVPRPVVPPPPAALARLPPMRYRPLRHGEFLVECLFRNPAYRHFKRTYPGLWDATTLSEADREAWRREVEKDGFFEAVGGPPGYIRVWSAFSRPAGGIYLGLIAVGAERRGLREILPWFDRYWEITGLSRDDWAERLGALWRAWRESSIWDIARLDLSYAFDPFVIGDEQLKQAKSRGPLGRFGGRLTLAGLAEEARIWVPIYRNTTKEDLDWDELKRLQREQYGRETRKRPREWERYLKAWDLWYAVPQPPVREIAVKLRLSFDQAIRAVRAARRLVRVDLRDVKAGQEERALKALERHFRDCPICKRGPKLCARGEALLRIAEPLGPMHHRADQDRESLPDPGQVDEPEEPEEGETPPEK